MSKFIEVGFTATRDPVTKEFLPAVPLYIESTEETKQSEAALINDLGRLYAARIRQYIEGGGLVGNATVAEGNKERKDF